MISKSPKTLLKFMHPQMYLRFAIKARLYAVGRQFVRVLRVQVQGSKCLQVVLIEVSAKVSWVV